MDVLSPIFKDAVVAGVPLLALLIGLVQFIKGFNLQGTVVRVVSYVVGLLLGVGYNISVSGVPADFAGWFAVVVFGLGLGLVGSGIYDAANK